MSFASKPVGLLIVLQDKAVGGALYKYLRYQHKKDGMLSNCVHCMLKGKSKNQLISKKAQAIALDNTNALTPNSIKWWARIEQKYSRKVIKSDKNEYTNIGFFGASKAYVYQTWVDELGETNEEDLIKLSEEDSWNMDCNCTPFNMQCTQLDSMPS
jgi:hypothetical protein